VCAHRLSLATSSRARAEMATPVAPGGLPCSSITQHPAIHARPVTRSLAAGLGVPLG
jgi:hypothetical protein